MRRPKISKLGLTKRKPSPKTNARVRYEPDNGPLTGKQMEDIRKLVPQDGFASSNKRLF